MSCVAGLALMVAAPSAKAGPVTFSFGPTVNNNEGSTLLSASAVFANVAGNLQITLTNTATSDVMRPSDILSALFFDIAGDPTLTSVSAHLAADGFLSSGTTTANPNLNVGGEWAYNANVTSGSVLGGGGQGISSTGLGVFGGPTFFGPNIAGPVAVNGLQMAIVNAADDPTTGNAPVTGGTLLSGPSVVFTLSGLAADFDPIESGLITNVSFLYGTSLSGPQYCTGGNDCGPTPPVIAEPGTLALFGLGLAGFAYTRRRKIV